ncbi:GNAT family N-acetyltransferase [Pelagicoccus sp. SDUM812002]|uniref:GNAT family N-acetyltransferase n=1 Tax=Pelagicoccus sp. SDUM812002 TaxID=3041266 RepID=UPI00280CC315|nr:GNAT family N-acetyltransferase [Pelagicoccus sp. SDUM812002]MDQ8185192.1 GNAT family N-acetyltransferase [Pelagicoccus sp. SDUM812002]
MDPAAKVMEVDFSKSQPEIRAVRFEVFVEEQRVPAEMEMDEWDERSRHVLAYWGGRAVGTGRLLPNGHIGRVAVLEAFRGNGVGMLLMHELMRMGETAGMARFILSSQTQASAFYERLGFSKHGGIYEEAGIPHIEMVFTT